MINQPPVLPADRPLPAAVGTLTEHVLEALMASARRVLVDRPDAELREALAERLEAIVEGRDRRKLYGRLDVKRGRRGRIDTRSLVVSVWLVDHGNEDAEPEQVCRVRVADLVDADGRPIDARADARTLLLQNGIGVPDDPSALL